MPDASPGLSRRAFVRNALVAGTAGLIPNVAFAQQKHATAEIMRSALVVNGLDPSALRVEYLDMLRAGGVNCWHHSVGSDFASFAQLLAFFDANRKRIAPAGSVREIKRLKSDGVIAHLAGWQSASGLIVDGVPAFDNLRVYHELGLRICGISYNVTNAFGGGCFDPDVGLTRAGHQLVEEVHRSHIVLDVAGHTNEKTSLEAIAISGGVPVICSHTNMRSLNDNPRCSTDRMLEAIARTGGVIGLSAFSDFHVRKASDAKVIRSPQASLARHLDQFDYLKRLVGVDHIGIGPDFLEGRNDPGPLSASDQILMSAEAYSQETPWFYVKGFEKIDELPNVVRGLLQRGWTAPELRKMLGENWLRVYETIWGS